MFPSISDLYPKLKFVRYGNVTNNFYKDVKYYMASECAKLPNEKKFDVRRYYEILSNANIIFAPVHMLHRLNRYEKFIKLDFISFFLTFISFVVFFRFRIYKFHFTSFIQ